MRELVACEQVGYRQQGADILADVDWRIERGQHWAVLGPNGSGKTTLLRIVCGYLWPTSGRLAFDAMFPLRRAPIPAPAPPQRLADSRV
jgi:iron complex transport system ATP-binding protein